MYKHGLDKGRLVVIGKYAKPRCFKDFDPNNLLIIYEYATKVWLTSELFKKKMHNTNAKVYGGVESKNYIDPG